MSKQYIIGIDSGTSKVKTVLADLRGRELAIAAETTPVETPFDGWSEYDLQKDWQNVARAVQKLLFQNRVNPDEIMAVGVTGKGWGCCYLDAKNRPARKGILWNDARSGPYIQKWAESGILSEAFKISGNYYYTGDCGPITRWLMDNEPQTVKQVASALFPTDWIAYKLTGKLRLVEGDASSLFDMYSRAYSDKLFDLLGISAMRSRFPAPASSSEVTGEVTTAAARATGLKAGTPVVLAEVDVSSCATGVGVIDLRSDTVTRPTPAMREAMAAAEVGDDVYGVDPSVNRLQERTAELLGKPAALFVPSGTMGNQAALLAQTRPGDVVLVGEHAHMLLYESGAPAAFAGVLLQAMLEPSITTAWSEGAESGAEILSGIVVGLLYFLPLTKGHEREVRTE